MQFSEVLEVHGSFTQPNALEAVLGDAFLLETNSVYRKVREFSLKIGCQYVEAYPRYLLLPFHELPKILETRRVPYVPHAQLMAEVESQSPGLFSTEEVPMPESYHLHEAAHVIAEHVIGQVPTKGDQEKILKFILCESFANTVDALVCVEAKDDVHRFFLKLNCYMHPQKKAMQAQETLIETVGFKFTFLLTYMTYVQANFLAAPLKKKYIEHLLKIAAPGTKSTPKILKDIQTVCALGEKLDPLFRVTTTGNYLKQQGFGDDIQATLDFDFQEVYESNEGFKRAVGSLADTLKP